MGIYRDVIIFVAAILVIVKSADYFTSGAAGIAEVFGIPKLIIGLTIVSLATTAPEFTVSVLSSYMKIGGMAVGNALGSCIANIGLILALAAIIKTIHFKPREAKQEALFLLCIAFFLFLLMLDHRLSFFDGLILSALLIGFFFFVIRREFKKGIKREELPHTPSLKKNIFKFLLGGAGVCLSARLGIIPSGVNIARYLGLPEIVIGLSLVAVGTSLPELFTALAATFKKMGEMAAGNILGANILNILWVLGASSMVRPLPIDNQTLKLTMPLILFITLIMIVFMRRGNNLIRKEGIFLFLIYAGYLLYLFKFAYA